MGSSRTSKQKQKDRVADLLKGRQEGEGKGSTPDKRGGQGAAMQRQNSL